MGYITDVLKNKWAVPKATTPSFEGLNIIITGANVGLGYETALKCVQFGAAKVILAVRTLSKGEEAKRKIDAQANRKNVTEVWQLDMLSYDSIKAFAAKATNELEHLDVAILNAGIVSIPFQLAETGHEKTIQVNVLSTALLSLLLLPKLKNSKTPNHTPVLEIVGSSNSWLISKLASTTAPVYAYDDPSNYNPGNQYNVSKVFVNAIQTALVPLVANSTTGEPDVFIPVVCPGACKSELARDAKAWYFRLVIAIMAALIQRTTEEGARTYVSGVENAGRAHGRFWKDDAIKP